jgi:two-component system CheB/CheR fusion protein
MDGLDVARQLREDLSFHSPCLLALSGYSEPEDIERSKAAGFRDHLAKPVDPVALETAFAQVCGLGG